MTPGDLCVRMVLTTETRKSPATCLNLGKLLGGASVLRYSALSGSGLVFLQNMAASG